MFQNAAVPALFEIGDDRGLWDVRSGQGRPTSAKSSTERIAAHGGMLKI
jgi:hypothetical protein